jgi:xylulokinase
VTLFIGLDLGTTTIKAAAYDASNGCVAALASCPTPVHHEASGRAEHDPEAFWRAAAGCLRALAEQTGGRKPDGLAIASFAEAGLPLDAAMRPLYPIIAWYDRRTEPQAAWWDGQIGAEALHAITGQRASPSFGVTKWLWLREHYPEAAARTAFWLSAPDYLMWRLAGVAATDYSVASRTLLFDQRRLDWSPELLALAGLSASQLPSPRPAGSPVGGLTPAAAGETGLPVGLPCVLGGHDHLCAALAAGVHRPGAIADSSGTAQAVLAVLPAFHTGPAAAQGGFACYAHVAPGQYILKAGLKMAGGAVEWLARLLSGPGVAPPPYAELAGEAAAGVGRRAGPLWLPHLIGSGTPEGDRLSLAALVGLRVEHDRGDLFRGLLESLALWLRHNVDAVAELTGQTPAEVILLGGLTRLPLLSQLKADCLGLPAAAPDLPEAAATGAALLAGLGTGYYRETASACASVRFERRIFAPDPERAAHYDRLYREVYTRLYGDLHAANAALTDFSRGAGLRRETS